MIDDQGAEEIIMTVYFETAEEAMFTFTPEGDECFLMTGVPFRRFKSINKVCFNLALKALDERADAHGSNDAWAMEAETMVNEDEQADD